MQPPSPSIARVRASSTADILRACEVAEEFDLRDERGNRPPGYPRRGE